MALACVLDASAAVRLILGDPTAAGLAELIRAAPLVLAVDRVEPDRHLQAEALALACHLGHPVYDCLYLSLARREAATLITTDRRLQQLAVRVLP
jgi:predicted nucleic acid-binding protein